VGLKLEPKKAPMFCKTNMSFYHLQPSIACQAASQTKYDIRVLFSSFASESFIHSIDVEYFNPANTLVLSA